ncbi:MAG: AsmA family protein, partial [Alphaproteobacteria bacterium]
MRKFLIGLIVILAAIAAVVVIGPNFVDWNAYKGQLAAQVEAATGRRLTIDGDLSLSILPTPRFSASGVRLGNIAGANSPDMIRLDTARVRIALAPLLQGILEVETVELISPRIELERLADGRTNWSFEPTASPAGSPGSGGSSGFSVPEIKFNDIRIRNGTLVYRDQTSGLVEHIENINASIVAGSFEGPFRAEGEFRARDLPLQMRLAVGRLLADRAVPVSLVVGVGDESDTAEFSGVLSGFPGEARLNGSLALRSDDTAAFLTAFPGAPIGIGAHPATVEGELTVSSAGISLNGVSLRLARASATGAVQFTFGSPSRLDVVLNIGQVDFDQMFAPSDDAAAASSGTQSGGTTPAEPPRPFAANRSGAGSFALPQNFDASLEAKIDALVLNGGILRQVRVTADLANGELTLNQASAQLPGGSDVSLFGLVVPIDGKPVFDGQFEANSDNFRSLLSWLNINVGDIPAGRLRKFELAAKVKATPDELTMSGIDMQLDLSSIRGGVAIALRRRPGFGIGLSVDRINLD